MYQYLLWFVWFMCVSYVTRVCPLQDQCMSLMMRQYLLSFVSFICVSHVTRACQYMSLMMCRYLLWFVWIICVNYITRVCPWHNAYRRMCEWVMSRIQMSHVPHTSESCHTCTWVMSHTCTLYLSCALVLIVSRVSNIWWRDSHMWTICMTGSVHVVDDVSVSPVIHIVHMCESRRHMWETRHTCVSAHVVDDVSVSPVVRMIYMCAIYHTCAPWHNQHMSLMMSQYLLWFICVCHVTRVCQYMELMMYQYRLWFVRFMCVSYVTRVCHQQDQYVSLMMRRYFLSFISFIYENHVTRVC